MKPERPSRPPPLASLLEAHREGVRRFVARRAGRLERFEEAEDLVQGIFVRALEAADRFELRSPAELEAWLFRIARQHLVDRARHWLARKRDAGKLLRITAVGTSPSRAAGGVDPAAAGAGPATRASRGELLALAVEAVGLLLPRDRELVQGASRDVPLADVARRLEISYDAAERARLRALERFRKAFALLERKRRRSSREA